MNRRVTWVIGGWCVAAVLLAAVATAGPVHLGHAPHPSTYTGGASDLHGAPAPFYAPGVDVHVPVWVGIAIEIRGRPGSGGVTAPCGATAPGSPGTGATGSG